MLQHFPDEVIATLKDRLRDVRQMARQRRGLSLFALLPDGPGKDIATRALEDLADAVDGAFGVAGKVTRDLAPRDHPLRAEAFVPAGLGAYGFSNASSEGERHFRRDLYAGGKRVLALIGEDAQIEESRLVAVWTALSERGALDVPLRWQSDTGAQQAGRLAASLLLALMRQEPIDNPAIGPRQRRMLNAGIFAPLVLALLLADKMRADSDALTEGDGEAPDLLELSVLALKARRQKLMALIDGPEPAREIAAMFALLVAHLP